MDDWTWVWFGLIVGLQCHVLYQVHQLRVDVRWLSHRLGIWYGRGMSKHPIYYAVDPEAKPGDQPGPYIKWSGR